MISTSWLARDIEVNVKSDFFVESLHCATRWPHRFLGHRGSLAGEDAPRLERGKLTAHKVPMHDAASKTEVKKRPQYHINRATRDEISGWCLGEGAPAAIELFINGRLTEVCIQRVVRHDVGQALPDVPHAAESGFRIILPTERLDSVTPISSVGVTIASGGGAESVSFSLPSAINADSSAEDYWSMRQSPFPPQVMALIENASEIDWRALERWSEDAVSRAVEVLLFLFKVGSRRAKGLFSYFSFLSRVAHAFQFTEKHFPRMTSSSGKDHDAVASSAQEHFLIAHHLMTLKAHGVEGDFLEFGCFKGFSTSCLSFACLLLNIRMHVFDSFEGLPASDSNYYSTGDFAGSSDEVFENVENFGSPQVVTWHRGFFADVVPKIDIRSVASLWLDVDLESSSRDVMRILPRLHPKGCVFSHECWPEHFDKNGNITAQRGPDFVLTPIMEAFTADNRRPTGRYLLGRTGTIWDDTRSIPPPAPAMLRLYDAILGR
jgi:O-methyltransferase